MSNREWVRERALRLFVLAIASGDYEEAERWAGICFNLRDDVLVGRP